MKQFQKVFKRKWCGCDIERSFMKGRDFHVIIISHKVSSANISLCSLRIHIRVAIMICLILENPGNNDA